MLISVQQKKIALIMIKKSYIENTNKLFKYQNCKSFDKKYCLQNLIKI